MQYKPGSSSESACQRLVNVRAPNWILTCRQYEVNELYNFETWGRQLSAFVAEVVKEPAFLICNSVGGRALLDMLLAL